jgi:hypothetical protein
MIDFVTCLQVASFPPDTTKKILIQLDKEGLTMEINLEKVISGWINLPDEVLKKYRRTLDGKGQLRLDMSEK